MEYDILLLFGANLRVFPGRNLKWLSQNEAFGTAKHKKLKLTM